MATSRRQLSAIAAGLMAVALGSSVALAQPIEQTVTYTVNPGAVGAPQAPFTAAIVDFSYTATVNQQTTGGASTCTVLNPCNFQETGRGSFSNFKQADFVTPVINSGLNHDPGYTMTGVFSGTGTVQPLAGGAVGLEANFNTFDLEIFADDVLVMRSTGLIDGQAHVFGADLAKGDFHILVNMEPVGGFFGSPLVVGLTTGNFAGNNTFIEGFTFGNFTGGTIEGSGNLSFNIIPEPSTLLLLGSGLAGIGIWRRRTMTTA